MYHSVEHCDYKNRKSKISTKLNSSKKDVRLNKLQALSNIYIINNLIRPSDKKNQIKNETTYNQIKKDIPRYDEKIFELPFWLQNSNGSPVELFELFYDEETIDLI